MKGHHKMIFLPSAKTLLATILRTHPTLSLDHSVQALDRALSTPHVQDTILDEIDHFITTPATPDAPTEPAPLT